MCTLTVFPCPEGVAVTMNRDEHRSRHEGETLVTGNCAIENISYCHPVDSHAGGTWFGVNSQGLVAALLNRYQEPQRTLATSRGDIIPRLFALDKKTVLKVADGEDWSVYNPFDLVLVWQEQVVRYRWDGRLLRKTVHSSRTPFFLTSSSIDLARVSAFRQQCFREFVARQSSISLEPEVVLRRLHLVQYADDPSASIFMNRPGRHTKSICQAVADTDFHECRYFGEESLRAGADDLQATAIVRLVNKSLEAVL